MKYTLRSAFLYSGIIFAASSSAALAQSPVPAQCPVITGFMKMGAANDTEEVLKLQAFLREHEGLAVELTGIFDQQTQNAVKTFQRAYMADIMGPWDATRPSGIVFISTIKKINQLACGTPVAFDTDEQSMMSDYRRAALAAEAQNAATGSAPMAAAPAQIASDAAHTEGMAASSTDNTAAAGNVPLINRFIHFIASFFQH